MNDSPNELQISGIRMLVRGARRDGNRDRYVLYYDLLIPRQTMFVSEAEARRLGALPVPAHERCSIGPDAQLDASATDS